MSSTATVKRKKNMDRGHFEPDEQLEQYLESLSTTELRELASYARKKAAGREDPGRKPGGEGGRRLSAQMVRGSGPYFYLHTYRPGRVTHTDEYGYMKSGTTTTKYVGRRLPADLAEEFGYPEGATPEETGIHVTGTPRHGSSRKQNSE